MAGMKSTLSLVELLRRAEAMVAAAKPSPEVAQQSAVARFLLGSENVFADLGIPRPEIAMLKANLCLDIKKIVKGLGWNTAKTRRVFGMTSEKYRQFTRGKLADISLENLLDCLILLRQYATIDVHLRIRFEGQESPLLTKKDREALTKGGRVLRVFDMPVENDIRKTR